MLLRSVLHVRVPNIGMNECKGFIVDAELMWQCAGNMNDVGCSAWKTCGFEIDAVL